MDQPPVSVSMSLDQALPAIIFVSLFLAWRFATYAPVLRRFVANHMWAGAVVELILFPAAAFGIGQLALALLAWTGQSALQEATSLAASLLLHLGFAIGFGRVCEVWILTKDGDTTETRLSNLARALLYSVDCQ